MKKNILIGIFAVIIIFNSSLTFGIGAIINIPGTQLVVPGKISDVPEYIMFNEASAISVSEFPMWAVTYFGLSDDYNFHLVNSVSDQLGFVHYRYRQTYNGIPIEGTMYILHVKDGKIISMNGELFNNISLGTVPVLSEASALPFALADINATVYKWQVPGENEQLKSVIKNADATYFPKGELVYVAVNGKLKKENLRLAWKYDVYAVKPLSRNYVFVDALTGEVIRKKERIHTTDTNGTAITAYSGSQTIVTDSYNGSFRLHETGRGGGINTYNMQEGTNYGNAVDFTDADNTWNNVNANLDQYATDAHWGAEMTYDYYLLRHNRYSIDDADFPLNSYVHYDVSYANAFWNGQEMTYGDGSGTSNPFTALDITGHEITHGVTTFSSDLDYQDESGALNESYSDIFGTAIEFFARPGNANWLVGADIGITIRSMSNPNAYGDPDTYGGTNWYTGTADNGGVHTNSGVQNRWFYVLTQGATGTNDIGNAYSVTGIGMIDAAAIAYRTNCFYLTSTSQYSDARYYSIQSAIDLFGACTPQVISTTNAWYSVGVGPAFVMGVTAGFSANLTTSCSVPFTVAFTNTSSNAGTFVWDFGDATTSTAPNPVHVYTNFGVYTVKLYADGGACGNDSLIQTSLINLTDMSPSANGVTICSGSTATLSATGTPLISWYANASGGVPLATGNSFNTPPLFSSTNYYVGSTVPGTPANVGPVNNTFAAGGNHNNTSIQYLEFDVYQPCTLLTAWVLASTAGNRNFNLWDGVGNLLQTYTVNVPNGPSTITLNIPLSVGSYRIGGTSMNLYRNSAGAVFPYVMNGVVSISGSSAAGRYYYLYNWNIQPQCITNRNPVPVTIALDNQSVFTFNNVANTYTFNDNSTAATSWFWNFGDLSTSTQQNPVHTYTGPTGAYTVMHVVSDGTCSDTSFQNIDVINGITELSGLNSIIYPNPAANELRIKNDGLRIERVAIYDMLGQKVYGSQIESVKTNSETVINISALAPGAYSIEVIAADKKGTGRFVKQ